jgi:hypothetical protein
MAEKRSKRLFWFIFLCIAGVSLLATIAMIIKAIIL